MLISRHYQFKIIIYNINRKGKKKLCELFKTLEKKNNGLYDKRRYKVLNCVPIRVFIGQLNSFMKVKECFQ